MLAFGEAECDVGGRLDGLFAHRNLDSPLDFANVLAVGIEPVLVSRGKVFLDESKFPRDCVENTGALAFCFRPLVRALSIAEQALERDTRIDFSRKRLG